MLKKKIFAHVGIILIGLIIFGLVFWRIQKQSQNKLIQKTSTSQSPQSWQPTQNRDQNQTINNSQSGLGACPSDIGQPIFDTIPMDLNNVRAFRPLGFLQPPIHIFGAKHSSFTINLPGEPVKSGLPVYFPSDATVTLITSTYGDQKGYQVTFYPCEELKAYLFHLGSLSQALLDDLAQDEGECQNFDFGNSKIKKCEKKTKIRVKSGDLVGTNDVFGGVDFGAVDYRVKPHGLANLDHYDGDYPYYVSPVNYFVPAKQALLEEKLRSVDGSVKRTAEPFRNFTGREKLSHFSLALMSMAYRWV